jgi:hypothetical protein
MKTTLCLLSVSIALFALPIDFSTALATLALAGITALAAWEYGAQRPALALSRRR